MSEPQPDRDDDLSDESVEYLQALLDERLEEFGEISAETVVARGHLLSARAARGEDDVALVLAAQQADALARRGTRRARRAAVETDMIEQALRVALAADDVPTARRLAEASVWALTQAGPRHDPVARSRQTLLWWLRWREDGDPRWAVELAELLADVEEPDDRDAAALRILAAMLAERHPLDAAAALERALAWARAAGGELSPLSAAIRSDLAALWEGSDPDAATAAHLDVLRTLGGDRRRALRWVRQRGLAVPDPVSAGLPDDPDVAALRRRVVAAGEGYSSQRALLLTDLGQRLQSAGELEQARLLFQQLAEDAAAAGQEEAAVAAANRAGILAEELGGDVREEWGELLARSEAAAGEDHHLTQVLRHNLADTCVRLGEMDEAAWLWGHNLLSLERSAGAGTVPALETRRNLARVHLSTGRVVSAYLLAARALDEADRVLTPGDELLLELRNTLALVLEALGQGPEAQALMEATVAEAEQGLGEDHLGTVSYRDNLAVMYLRRGLRTEAEPLWRRSREAIAEGRAMAPGQPDLARVLADELQRADEPAAAAQVLDESFRAQPSDETAIDWARAALAAGTVDLAALRREAENDALAAMRLSALAQIDGSPDEALRLRHDHGLGLMSRHPLERDAALALVESIRDDREHAAEALEQGRQLLGTGHPAVCGAVVAHLAWLAERDVAAAQELVATHLDAVADADAWDLPPVAGVLRAAVQLERELGSESREAELLATAARATADRPSTTALLRRQLEASRAARTGHPREAVAVIDEIMPPPGTGPVPPLLRLESERVLRAAERLPRQGG